MPIELSHKILQKYVDVWESNLKMYAAAHSKLTPDPAEAFKLGVQLMATKIRIYGKLPVDWKTVESIEEMRYKV